jgi:hypothetical protein
MERLPDARESPGVAEVARWKSALRDHRVDPPRRMTIRIADPDLLNRGTWITL